MIASENVLKTAGWGVEVETDPFFSVRKISYLIKIVQNSKYLTDLLDGPNLFDAWNEHKHDLQRGWLFVLFDW